MTFAPNTDIEVIFVSGTIANPEGITNPPIDELLDKTQSKYSLVIFAAKITSEYFDCVLSRSSSIGGLVIPSGFAMVPDTEVTSMSVFGRWLQ
jgi:hypothetical protein